MCVSRPVCLFRFTFLFSRFPPPPLLPSPFLRRRGGPTLRNPRADWGPVSLRPSGLGGASSGRPGVSGRFSLVPPARFGSPAEGPPTHHRDAPQRTRRSGRRPLGGPRPSNRPFRPEGAFVTRPGSPGYPRPWSGRPQGSVGGRPSGRPPYRGQPWVQLPSVAEETPRAERMEGVLCQSGPSRGRVLAGVVSS